MNKKLYIYCDMFTKIYEILVDILGESKQGGYDKDILQYQFNCPCCREENGGIPDGKFNLEINFQHMVHNCWKCGDTDETKGPLSKLIRRYGSITQYKSYKDEIESIKRSKLYDFNLYSGFTFDIESEEYRVKLPKTFHKLVLSSCNNTRLVEYCKKRGIDQNIINKFNIGYTTWDEEDYGMRNRIIIPSYDSYGDLNYFIGRDFTGKSKMKYKNCEADKKRVVFQESTINIDADIVLVEGGLDCLYYPNTIALLGKHLTRDTELYNFLMNKSHGRIIIAIDGDTDISETKRIYNLLDFGKLHNKIWYINLKDNSIYKDFGEIYENEGKTGLIKIVKSAKQFNDFEKLI